MAKSGRVPKKPNIRYFFLNKEHHRVLRISRAEDLITAWNYAQGKRCTYVWSLVQKEMQRAFTVSQAGKIFHRDRLVINEYIRDGRIKKPAQTYPIGMHTEKPGKYLLSEDDMRELHDYLLTVHRGRPRKDGQITHQSNLISRAELEALMREDKVLYTKDNNGEFVPVWKQPDW